MHSRPKKGAGWDGGAFWPCAALRCAAPRRRPAGPVEHAAKLHKPAPQTFLGASVMVIDRPCIMGCCSTIASASKSASSRCGRREKRAGGRAGVARRSGMRRYDRPVPAGHALPCRQGAEGGSLCKGAPRRAPRCSEVLLAIPLCTWPHPIQDTGAHPMQVARPSAALCSRPAGCRHGQRARWLHRWLTLNISCPISRWSISRPLNCSDTFTRSPLDRNFCAWRTCRRAAGPEQPGSVCVD